MVHKMPKITYTKMPKISSTVKYCTNLYGRLLRENCHGSKKSAKMPKKRLGRRFKPCRNDNGQRVVKTAELSATKLGSADDAKFKMHIFMQ